MQKGRGSRRSRRTPTSPWATPSSSPAGPRATPSPRSSGCGTSECFRMGCWVPGPRHRMGCWGPRSQPSEWCWTVGPSHQMGCWGYWTGCWGRWVPAIGRVLNSGSQPSEGCWAPGPCRPGTPGAPGCLPTLTFPPPPTDPSCSSLEGMQRGGDVSLAPPVVRASRPGSLGWDQTPGEDWVFPMLWGPEPAGSVIVAMS